MVDIGHRPSNPPFPHREYQGKELSNSLIVHVHEQVDIVYQMIDIPPARFLSLVYLMEL